MNPIACFDTNDLRTVQRSKQITLCKPDLAMIHINFGITHFIYDIKAFRYKTVEFDSAYPIM